MRAGDVVYSVQQLSEQWWHGTLNDRQGTFPASYARMASGPVDKLVRLACIDVVGMRLTAPQGRALYPYEAADETQLTLETDDVVCDISEGEDEGWSHGRIADRQGLFPTQFVDRSFVHV